jgi:uncharacterized integral membrane protein
MKRETIIRAAVVTAILAMLAIVVAQNTDDVEMKILFLTITMPRVLWLFLAIAIGALGGWLFLRARSRRGRPAP